MTWGVSFYKDESGALPAQDFLRTCPVTVRSHLTAVLKAVRDAPPTRFSGGGQWEAMHGSMGGYFEVRATGPGRRQYRLFCRLENGSIEHLQRCGFDRPQLVVIAGMIKPNAKLFSDREYEKHVRVHGERYLETYPRPVTS